LSDERGGLGQGEVGLHDPRVITRVLEQRDEQHRLVQRVAGPAHQGALGAAQQAGVLFEGDLLGDEADDLLGVVVELLEQGLEVELAAVDVRAQLLDQFHEPVEAGERLVLSERRLGRRRRGRRRCSRGRSGRGNGLGPSGGQHRHGDHEMDEDEGGHAMQ
jgi:hypothetical protein